MAKNFNCLLETPEEDYLKDLKSAHCSDRVTTMLRENSLFIYFLLFK